MSQPTDRAASVMDMQYLQYVQAVDTQLEYSENAILKTSENIIARNGSWMSTAGGA
jgi:hypothetical protein